MINAADTLLGRSVLNATIRLGSDLMHGRVEAARSSIDGLLVAADASPHIAAPAARDSLLRLQSQMLDGPTSFGEGPFSPVHQALSAVHRWGHEMDVAEGRSVAAADAILSASLSKSMLGGPKAMSFPRY